MPHRQLWTAPQPGVPIEREIEWLGTHPAKSRIWIRPNAIARDQARAAWNGSEFQRQRARIWDWDDLWRNVHARVSNAPGLLSQAGARAVLDEALRRACAEGLLSDSAAEFGQILQHRRLLKVFESWSGGLDDTNVRPANAEAVEWRIFEHYRSLVEELGEVDLAGLARWACQNLPSAWDGTCGDPPAVLVSHIENGDSSAIAAVRQFIRNSNDIVLTACDAAASEARPGARESRLRAHWKALGFEAVDHDADLSRRAGIRDVATKLFSDQLAADDAADGVFVCGVPEGEGEAIAAASTVKAWLDAGVPASKIAIVFPEWTELTERVRQKLHDQGIEISGGPPVSLTGDAAVGALMLTLRIIDHDWPTRDVVRLLRNTSFAPPWPEFASRDEFAQTATILAGLHVVRGVEGILAALARKAADAGAESAARGRRRASIEPARAIVDRLHAALSQPEGERSWPDQMAALREISYALGFSARDAQASGLDTLWLELEDEGATTARIAGVSNKLDWAEFSGRVCRAALELTSPGQATVTNAVPFFLSSDLVGCRHSHRVIVGLSQSVWPRRESIERERLASDSGGASAFVCEMREFTNIFASTLEEVVLISPTTDAKGIRVQASGFLEDVRRVFSDRAWADCHDEYLRLDPVALKRFSNLDRERVVVSIQALAAGSSDDHLALGIDNARCRASIEGVAIAARVQRKRLRQTQFGAFDGMLSDRNGVASIGERLESKSFAFSPRQIQTYIDCPFKFYQDVILRLSSDREFDLLGADHARVGGQVHQLLAALHHRLNALADESPIEEAGLREALRLLASDRIDDGAATDSVVAGAMRRIDVSRAERLLRQFAEQQARYALLHAIDSTEVSAPIAPDVEITLDSGTSEAKTLRLRGAIDRIDASTNADGQALRLIDYKSSDAPSANEIRNGLSIELPLMMLNLEQARAPSTIESGAWSIKDRGFRPLVAGAGARSPRWSELRPRLLQYVVKLLTGMQDGRFPVAPRKELCERRCQFRQVCRISQVRGIKQWNEQPMLTLEGASDAADDD